MTTNKPRVQVLWASPSPRLKQSAWCTSVSRGDEAVKAFQAHRHDLVLCDMRGLLDGMSGSRLYQTLKAIEPGVRVVLMSSGYTGANEVVVAGGRVRVIDPTEKSIKEALASIGILLAPAPLGDGGTSAPAAANKNASITQQSSSSPSLPAISKVLSIFVGPLAQMEIDEAIERLANRGIKSPSGAEVAKEVATSIPDKEARTQFINLVFSPQKK